MRAFEVSINGKRVCRAAVGDQGVLTAIVSWASKDQPTDRLEVSGLDSVSREHSAWGRFTLSVGDNVTIRVLDVAPDTVDPPTDGDQRNLPLSPPKNIEENQLDGIDQEMTTAKRTVLNLLGALVLPFLILGIGVAASADRRRTDCHPAVNGAAPLPVPG